MVEELAGWAYTFGLCRLLRICVRGALTGMALKGNLKNQMSRPKRMLKGVGANRRGSSRVGAYSVAFKTSKSSPRGRQSMLLRLDPEIRTLVRKTVARYDEELRRLARH